MRLRVTVLKEQLWIDTGRHDLMDLAIEFPLQLISNEVREGDAVERERIDCANSMLRARPSLVVKNDLDLLATRMV